MKHDSFTGCFMRGIHQLVCLIDKRADHELLSAGRPSLSPSIILFVLHHHQSCSQEEIAELLDLTPAAISRQISNLVEDGFITREAEPGNRRRHRIALTKKGKKEIELSGKILGNLFGPIFENIPKNRQKVIIDTFNELLNAFHSLPANKKK